MAMLRRRREYLKGQLETRPFREGYGPDYRQMELDAIVWTIGELSSFFKETPIKKKRRRHPILSYVFRGAWR